MKSKAHMKKCLELGVSMTSVDETETEEAGAWLTEWTGLLGGLRGLVIARFAHRLIKYSLQEIKQHTELLESY